MLKSEELLVSDLPVNKAHGSWVSVYVSHSILTGLDEVLGLIYGGPGYNRLPGLDFA